jgi:hypothetical protein
MEFAFSFPVRLFHPLQHAGLARRTPGMDSNHSSRPREGTPFLLLSVAPNDRFVGDLHAPEIRHFLWKRERGLDFLG